MQQSTVKTNVRAPSSSHQCLRRRMGRVHACHPVLARACAVEVSKWRAMLHHNSKTKLLSFHASAKLTCETRPLGIHPVSLLHPSFILSLSFFFLFVYLSFFPHSILCVYFSLVLFSTLRISMDERFHNRSLVKAGEA